MSVMVREHRVVGKVPIIGNSKTIYTHMKASELTHIIRQIVAEEIRKELPNAIAEVFQQAMSQRQPIQERVAPSPPPRPVPVEEPPLRQSLRELFAGTNVMPPKPNGPQAPRKLAKDPLLNDILNQTRPFSPQERMGAPVGAAAMMAAAQAGVSLPGAAPAPPMPMGSPMASMAEMMEEEPSFVRNMPSMAPPRPSAMMPPPMAPQVSQAALLNDNHIPMADLPEGVSAIDVAQYAPPAVADALTRDYSSFLKKVGKAADKRKGIV